MTIEVPVLRLGTAGYTEAQEKQASAAAEVASSLRARWELSAFADADAWWLEGSRTVLLPNEYLRVQPAVATERSVQLALADVDRPVAFSIPISAPGFKPGVVFQLSDQDAAARVLHQFADWMKVKLSQFALASSITNNQPSLGAGSWEVLRGGDLLAVVDLNLGAGVMPGVTPKDLAEASWCIRNLGAVTIPASYSRVSVSLLMWQYAQRTVRDLLPPHYRTKALYFRRPPRLPQRQLKDAHLLIIRELAANPGMDFVGLQQATGLGAEPLSRVLFALYVVGSITSNPKRAAAVGPRLPADPTSGSTQGAFQSELDSAPRTSDLPSHPINDMTAPLPLMRD
ncbi:MAG TPA: hypothetical protein VFB71_14750 [Ramlibacter sp.]|nr:hypothetical protein [Ramlibacter sp.]